MKNMEVHLDGLARPEQVRVDIKPKVEGVIVRIRLERGEAGIEPGLGQLNPAYIFDTFVAGPNNQFAVAAAKAVAANPATTYTTRSSSGEAKGSARPICFMPPDTRSEGISQRRRLSAAPLRDSRTNYSARCGPPGSTSFAASSALWTCC